MVESQFPIKIDAKIDSKDAENFLSKLLDTIKSPFEWWAKSNAPVHSAKAEVKAAMIKAKAIEPLAKELGISKEDAVSLILRNQELDQVKSLRQHRNIESIIQGAIEFKPKSISNDPVEEDWVADFFEQCKNISNQEMQSLWSKILSHEVAQPGSFSKRTLAFVRTISKKEAELFTKFCSLLWYYNHDHQYIHFVLSPSDRHGTFNYLKKYEISYENLLELDSLGLITYETEISLSTEPEKEYVLCLSYLDELYYCYPTRKEGCVLRSNVLRPSNLGQNLVPISGAEKNNDYRDEIIKIILKSGFYIYDKPPLDQNNCDLLF